LCKIDKAVNYFKQGFNCCQSILLTFGNSYGITSDTAIKIGSPFGGGMARTGETCGAVTGALMIIGVKYGKSEHPDEKADKITYEKSRQFLDEFNSANKTVICRDLIHADISTPEGLKMAQDQGIIKDICPAMVKSAAEILDSII